MQNLKLRHAPYGIFRSSRTPPGLYARQKWLQEASTAVWRADFAATVAELYQGRTGDGLWGGVPLESVHRLFGLHLTVRNPDPLIDRGLERLLARAASAPSARDPDRITSEQLGGLPFAAGSWQDCLVPAALFLASIFGKASDPAVLALYERMTRGVTPAGIVDSAPAAVHNVLRALVVHPDYAAHPATCAAVAWLADRQNAEGDWGGDIPFFQSLNALAHLDSPEAEAQCRKAFKWLVHIQNPDGSWGDTQREWCTFLSVHALRNKCVL